MPVMTGLSGNEIYCLHLKNMTPGELVVGNSVYSLGFVGSLGAGLRNMMGGEVTQVTQIIHEGRLQSFQRLQAEAQKHGGLGITGVSSELRHFHGNIEFLSVGSTVHAEGKAPGSPETLSFSTSHDAQELYCMLDANYTPHHFVFGNVAYSVGITGGLLGGLKSMARGEVKEFSDIFNHTRHLALQRIAADAAQYGSNAILGIETSVLPFQGVHEMMMIGTACFNPKLPPPAPGAGAFTSDLTAEETWNMAAMGYAPLKLVLGTAVYSLGLVGGFMAALKSFSRGEVNDLTSLIYDAREHAIGLIRQEANAIGADDVVGIKTHIHDLGNLLEFMDIVTAVKKLPNLAP
ncbi:MAG: heavy metal-binding domain-containing protein [Phycisphaerae bacterium]